MWMKVSIFVKHEEMRWEGQAVLIEASYWLLNFERHKSRHHIQISQVDHVLPPIRNRTRQGIFVKKPAKGEKAALMSNSSLHTRFWICCNFLELHSSNSFCGCLSMWYPSVIENLNVRYSFIIENWSTVTVSSNYSKIISWFCYQRHKEQWLSIFSLIWDFQIQGGGLPIDHIQSCK